MTVTSKAASRPECQWGMRMSVGLLSSPGVNTQVQKICSTLNNYVNNVILVWHCPMPWLETYSCQPVLDGKDGEQLQMLGLYFEKGKLWQSAGMGEVLLDGHQ